MSLARAKADLEATSGPQYVRLVSYNVFNDELEVEREDQHPGYTVGGTVLGKRVPMDELGATLYVLPPGNAQAPYHWHHNIEEALLVLAGRPTLRSPDEQRELQPGDLCRFHEAQRALTSSRTTRLSPPGT